VIFTLFLGACQTATKTDSSAMEQVKKDQIDLLANRYLELNRFSGTVIVAKGQSIIYHQNFGWADIDKKKAFSNKTAFKIGTITELVTSQLINKLAAQEKLQLSDRVAQYLPNVTVGISIQEVLNHNTGENSAIENISGESYQEQIEAYSKELGLENTYFQKQDTAFAVGYLYHNYRGKGLETQKSPTYNTEKAFSSKGLKATGKDLVKIMTANPKELQIDGYLEDDGFSYSVVHNSKKNISK